MDLNLRRLQRAWRTNQDAESAARYIAALERIQAPTEVAPLDELDYEIHKTLVLSTLHVPEELIARAQVNRALRSSRLIWMDTDYGWILGPIDIKEWEDEAASEDYREIWPMIDLAKRLGAHWIRLDTDGPVIEGLPAWDW